TVVNPSNPSATTTPNGGFSSPVNFMVGTPNPTPSITSLSPTSTNAGGPAFTLTVNGAGFLGTSQVIFNGKSEPTSFATSTELTAAIPAADIANPATVNVTVSNPAPGGGTSTPQSFTISNQPWVVSLSPNSGSGLSKTFSVVVADPSGLSDLKTMHLLFSSSPANQASVCHVYYATAVNRLYLYNDAGTTLSAGVAPGSPASASNSQCTLAGTGSSVGSSGNNLTVSVALTFISTFSGQKSVFVYSSGNNGMNTGWVQKGSWTASVPQPPTVVSLTPASGSGTAQTFSIVMSDPNGLSDLKTAHLLFGTSTANQAFTRHVYY